MNVQVHSLSCVWFLISAGRAPNSNRLNLEAVGVEVDKVGAIKVYLLSLFSLFVLLIDILYLYDYIWNLFRMFLFLS